MAPTLLTTAPQTFHTSLNMKKTIINVTTGETKEVTVFAYKNSANDLLVLEDGEPPPAGYTLATEAQINAIQAPAAIAKITEQIKAKRNELWYEGGVKVGEHWFSSDRDSLQRYNSLLQLSEGMPDSTVLRANWRTMRDGVTVDMTRGLVKQIFGAGFAQVAAIDDAAQAHIAALQQSESPAAYDYSTGWPEVFQA